MVLLIIFAIATILATASRVIYRFGTFVYWAIAMICVALDYQTDLKDREIRTADLEQVYAATGKVIAAANDIAERSANQRG